MRTILCVLLTLTLFALVCRADAAEPTGPPPLATRGPKPKPITPPKPGDINRSIRRGIDFLVKTQNRNGSWGSATKTKALNIYAPIPGAHHAFRSGTTGLCLAALIESGDPRKEVQSSIERAEKWMFDQLPRLRRANATAIYNVWGHAYATQALVRMHKRLPKDKKRQEKIVKLIRSQIEMLARYECVNGGWGYYDFQLHTRKPGGSPTSFTTATVLVAFHEARQIGVEPPKKLVKRAMTSIVRQRLPDYAYAYGEYLRMAPQRGINRPGGSLGRSQACNIALRYWGDKKITDKVLTTWLDRLYARNGWLSIGRKRPIPHESYFQVAGYFYYYGHYYAALCIDDLPADRRRHFQDHLAHILLKYQEKNGSWFDYPLYDYGHPYGTGYGVMTMLRCRTSWPGTAPKEK